MEIPIVGLSVTAVYAVQGMVQVAQNEGRFCLVKDVARARRLPANFLSKIFQRLARHGILRSHRGPGGGYALAKDAKRIRLAQILEAAQEPPAEPGRCLLNLKRCGTRNFCAIHGAVLEANRILQGVLEKTTLSDLVHAEKGV